MKGIRCICGKIMPRWFNKCKSCGSAIGQKGANAANSLLAENVNQG